MSKIEMKEVNTTLIIVDVQNDFCPGGNLAVADGDLIVEPLNKMIYLARKKGWVIVASRDYHPEVTNHFQKDGGIWPVHCVAGTEGAKFHSNLDLDGVSIVTKGVGVDENAYSAFDGTLENGQKLEEFLREHMIQRALIGGLATDYCVKDTALASAKLGFETYLLTDASKAVNLNLDADGNPRVSGPTDEALALFAMSRARVNFVKAESVLRWDEYRTVYC